ncbi:IS110 family transposase [Kitasatospora sp. MMS16-BH015]|nr:transposase [Kitasatospora sp. MMS16-BH015]AUG78181.1 IS110 family transposase [Kitasatospora sp. MMS16-BH015]
MFCGIDWASDHHDVAVVDGDGKLLGRAWIDDDAAGLQLLLGLLVEHSDSPDDRIPVVIETSRGLLVACLRASGPVNLMAAARYRERHSVSRKKFDPLDAMVLVNILRTDADARRQLPADSELAQAIAVLALAQQDSVWDRTQAGNKLRSHLREYFPGYLAAVEALRGGLAAPLARTLLVAAPTPEQAARLTRAQLRAVLKRAGRQRGIDHEVERLHAALRVPQMRQLPMVERAMGRQAVALLGKFEAACVAADELAEASVELFEKHPDAAIITSFPGLAALSGAWVLAEIGDDRTRFADAKALKAYAGSAPVTRASGKSRTVMVRRVKNQRLAAVGFVSAFGSLRASPGARAHYDRRRDAGDRHTSAQRNFYNRFLGCLHHCLATGTTYSETTAFPVLPKLELVIAA